MSLTRKILIIFLSIIFIFAGVKLILVLSDYSKAVNIYDESRQSFHIGASPSPEEEEESPLYKESFPDITIDFDKLHEVNPDVAAWIWIPDTEISYPVMIGEDNKQYLYTSYNNEPTSSGSIFMDYRNKRDFSDKNTLIFGHNMKNGSMFATLKSYAEQEFYDNHQIIYIFTPEADYKYRVFSAYKTQNDSKSYAISFKNEEKTQEYLDLVFGESLIETGLIPKAEDKMVLLSTCTSTIWNERFVVHGVLIGINEH